MLRARTLVQGVMIDISGPCFGKGWFTPLFFCFLLAVLSISQGVDCIFVFCVSIRVVPLE